MSDEAPARSPDPSMGQRLHPAGRLMSDEAPARDAVPSSDAAPEVAEMGLEARLARIEEIARTLDSDALGLDEALALFEEGVAHVRRAKARLGAAELKVEELTATGEDV